jgi:hypothetical protein
MIKYYQQIAYDMIKIPEEKLLKIFEREINQRKDLPDKDNLNPLNPLNTINNIYLLFALKFICKNCENSISQIQENNLNEEKEKDKDNNNINNNNNPMQQNLNQNFDTKNFKENSKNFMANFLGLLSLNKEDINKLKNEFLNFNSDLNSINIIDKKNYLNGSRTLVNLYINELVFIHFNEFLITLIKKERNESLYLCLIHLNILIGYFYWKDEQKVIL